jgi:hypothetical protein
MTYINVLGLLFIRKIPQSGPPPPSGRGLGGGRDSTTSNKGHTLVVILGFNPFLYTILVVHF